MPFKFVRNWGNEGITNVVETNLKHWMQDAFCRIGAYSRNQTIELRRDQSGSIGQEYQWQSPVKNWAWQVRDPETGLVVRSPATIFVNDEPESDVIIDYLRGVVTLNRVIDPAEDKVTALFTANSVAVISSLEFPRRPMVGFDPTGQDSDNFIGVFDQIKADYKIQPPFVYIRVYPTGSARPVCLGTGLMWVEQRIQMSVMTETEAELNKLLGYFVTQSYWTVALFNSNLASTQQAMPLDEHGDLNRGTNASLYDDLLKKFPVTSMYWDKWAVRKFNTNRQDFFLGMAHVTPSVKSLPSL